MALITRRVGLIIQARMGSRRFPGKVLERLGNDSLLGFLIKRVQRCRRVDVVVVATSTNPLDDRLVEPCHEAGVPVFRGSEGDVLQRYVRCTIEHQCSLVVRVTADNPLTDPEGIDELIHTLDRRRAVYAHNKHRHGYPVGTGAEVITAEALAQADRLAHDPSDREHVTTYVACHPEQFPTAQVDAPRSLQAPGLFFTVDYPEDLLLLRRLHVLVPVVPEGSLAEYLACLRAHPDLARLHHLHVEDEDQTPVAHSR